jgi:hypothetical protein
MLTVDELASMTDPSIIDPFHTGAKLLQARRALDEGVQELALERDRVIDSSAFLSGDLAHVEKAGIAEDLRGRIACGTLRAIEARLAA